DGPARLWDLATGREVRALGAPRRTVYSVAFSPDGALALLGTDDGALEVREVATGREVRTIRAHQGAAAFAVAFSPDGALALSGGSGKEIRLWEVATGREVRAFLPAGVDARSGHAVWWAHHSGVTALAFSPDGALALSASYDKTLKVWDVATGREVRKLT